MSGMLRRETLNALLIAACQELGVAIVVEAAERLGKTLRADVGEGRRLH